MKRLLHRATTGLVLALLLTLSACDLTSMNRNPNEPTEARIPYLFTNAQTDLADNYYGVFTLGYFTNYYSQYWAATTYPEEARFGFPSERQGVNSNMFEQYYFVLNDLQEIIRIARQTPSRAEVYGSPQDIIAIAKIQQAWVWQAMADIYGAVPYDSALAGRDAVRPGYAAQEQIYTSVIDTLATYSQQLSGNPALAGSDLIFGGDTEKWQAFANGLRMRLALRMSEQASGPAQSAFAAAYQASSFADLSGYQNATIPFGTADPYYNPLYGNTVIEGRSDWAVSRTLMRVLNEHSDPRRAAYAQTSPGGDYQGLPFGLTQELLPRYVGDYSLPGTCPAYTATNPAILYTESEERFMIAEAAERGWITANAEQNYNEGIRASMDYWSSVCEGVSIPSSEVEAYISRVPYKGSWAPATTGGTPAWQQTLGIQKWIALYMQGLQGWSTFRRLDFDNVFVVPPDDPGNTAFGATFPFRLPYPIEEPSLNGENWQQAISEFYSGEDSQGQPLWWDDDDFGTPLGESPID